MREASITQAPRYAITLGQMMCGGMRGGIGKLAGISPPFGTPNRTDPGPGLRNRLTPFLLRFDLESLNNVPNPRSRQFGDSTQVNITLQPYKLHLVRLQSRSTTKFDNKESININHILMLWIPATTRELMNREIEYKTISAFPTVQSKWWT